ncbi:MAG: ribosome silencing factor [Phycisphaerae bacterium]
MYNRLDVLPEVDIVADTAERTRQEELALARAFAIEAARTAVEDKCHNVRVLDVTHLSPLCDFMVLATGTSGRQMSTVAKDIEDKGHELEFPLRRSSGRDSESWIAQDYFDVVVHVFGQEARLYYDLDNLWGDAEEVDWATKPD